MKRTSFFVLLLCLALVTSTAASALSFFGLFKTEPTVVQDAALTTNDQGVTTPTRTVGQEETQEQETQEQETQEQETQEEGQTSGGTLHVTPSTLSHVDTRAVVTPPEEKPGFNLHNSNLAQLQRSFLHLNEVDLVSLARYRGVAYLNYNSGNDPALHKYGDDYRVQLYFLQDDSSSKSDAAMSEEWRNWQPGDKFNQVSELDLKFSSAHDTLQWFKALRELDRDTRAYVFAFATDDCEHDPFVAGMYRCTVDMESAGDELLLMPY